MKGVMLRSSGWLQLSGVGGVVESPSALNHLNLWSLIDQLVGHLHHTEQPARHTECTAPGLFLSCMVLYLGGFAIG